MMPFLPLLRGVRLKPLLNLEARSSEEILIPDFYRHMVGNKVLPRPHGEVMFLRHHSAQLVASGILYWSRKVSELLMSLYYEP